jgi:2'-5' RNA ligase
VARTAVVVTVPEAEPAVGEAYWTHTRSGRDGLVPHVTLLIPFADSQSVPLAETRAVIGSFEPFDFELTEVRRFAARDTVVWLAPEPADPFVAVMEALVRAFPQFPPYDGAFSGIVPHLTVAVGRDRALLDRIERGLVPSLPIPARADAAAIVQHLDGRWRTHTTIPFVAELSRAVRRAPRRGRARRP